MGDLENLEIEARRMEKKRKGNEQERKSKRRKLDRLVGWGDVPEASLPTGMETWRVKVTTTSTGEVQEEVESSRLEEETCRMLEKDIEKAKKQPEGRNEGSVKKNFIFNTKGKINKKECKELRRTHKNIFEWVQKEKEKVAEKDTFEKQE